MNAAEERTLRRDGLRLAGCQPDVEKFTASGFRADDVQGSWQRLVFVVSMDAAENHVPRLVSRHPKP